MEGELAAGAPYEVRSRRHAVAAAPFKKLDRVAALAIVFVTAHVVLDVFAVVTDVQMVGLLNRAKAGELVTIEEADALDVRMARIGLMQSLGVLITGIPFIVWFRRVYRNLPALGIRWLRFKLGWAVGGWFVPFLSVARPKSVVNDVWRATDPSLPREVDEPPAGGHVSPLLNWWWAAFVVSGFLYAGGSGAFEARPSLDELLWEAQRYAFADAISIAAGILAILVIRRVTARMQMRHAVVSAAEGATPTALGG
ncbi:MAG: DUF4328 domain-containing protein [Actinomycetota bacterium]